MSLPQSKVGDSVYDLREEEQLALAMQQSLDDEPELTVQDHADCAAGGGSMAAQHHAWLTPDRGAGVPSAPPPEDVEAVGPEEQFLVGGSSGSAGQPMHHPEMDPEWAGVGPEDAAAGGPAPPAAYQPVGQMQQPPPPPIPVEHRSLAPVPDAADRGGGGGPPTPAQGPMIPQAPPPASSSSGSSSVVHAPPPVCVSNSSTISISLQPPPAPPPAPPPSGPLEEAVQRSLEFATARRFDEAEQCLAQLASDYPELASRREVMAAWEAVAMCKQFHSGSASQ
eukprot:TRINITY_DN42688_c0_g1_i1.p1 TRINITY_DN42688_c0_g1~~TRINITY_DN42688_c0_g1_i1.p1  ORF type:complete len:281 (+),score=60.95 TRINITY_DN42688_c0_g1_i1:77-919(+)